MAEAERSETGEETTFTLRLTGALKRAFNRAAQARDLNSSQVLREFMRRFVATKPNTAPETPVYNDWFTEKVRLVQEDSRPSVPSAEVERRFARLRADSQSRASTKRKRGSRKP